MLTRNRESFDAPVWTSSPLFLGLAILISLLGWIATVPVFFGWWRLGRSVSMSPVEIAKAFGAPGLRALDSNADAQALLAQCGKQEVQYGVTMPSATAHPFLDREKGGRRLAMGRSDTVRFPDDGEILDG